MNVKVAPSILSADFGALREAALKVEKAGATWLHLDVMDGSFVPSITIGPQVLAALRPHSGLFMDAHLMVVNPERHIDSFADAGADSITVQVEATGHLDRALRRIRERGIKAGAALNPATSPETLDYVWHLLDLVLVMSVNPGAGGQPFIPEMLIKIERVADVIRKRNLPVALQVDGGINPETAPQVIKAGAEVLVAGSAIFGEKDGISLIRQWQESSFYNNPKG